MEADSGDLILQGHRSWGPVTDVRVILLNPNHEVSEANCISQNAPVHTAPIINSSGINLFLKASWSKPYYKPVF